MDRSSDGGQPQHTLPRQALLGIVLGLLVRELFAPWTGHPFDLESFVRTGYTVAHGGSPYVLSARPVPGASFAYLGESLPLASYPPFWPELAGGIFRFWESLPGANRFLLYALLKQPGIIGDAAVAYLLGRIALEWGAGVRTATYLAVGWSFFPYAIVISAIWGQFDSIVVALLLLGGLGTLGPIRRSVTYALGTLVKWFTAVLLPLEFFRARLPKARVGVVVAFSATLAVAAVPFLVQGWTLPRFESVAYYASHGNGLGMNFVYLLGSASVVGTLGHVPGLYDAIGFLWIPGAIVSGGVAARWSRSGERADTLRGVELVVLTVLLLRWGLYEQYLLYAFAPIALDLALFHPGRRRLALTFLTIGLAGLLANNDLGLRFLAPIDPGIVPWFEAIEAGSPWGVVRGIALTAVAVAMTATLVQWIYVLVKNQPRPRVWVWPLDHRSTRSL